MRCSVWILSPQQCMQLEAGDGICSAPCPQAPMPVTYWWHAPQAFISPSSCQFTPEHEMC